MPAPRFRLAVALGLGLSCLAAAHGQGGPGDPPPEVARAQQQMQAGDVAGTIATLEAFFAKNPDAGAGRLLLGNAYSRKGELDKALAAYRAVPAMPRPPHAQAVFAIAGIEARRGHAEAALEGLEQLAASGVFDMDLARASDDFAALRGSPRFAAAMWGPEDFANPFVETVRVIHEWVGEAKGDQFSWIARSIADVDGDGVREVVTSAPSFGGAPGAAHAPGKVYVYSGKSGKLLWSATGQADEDLGTGLEGAGDVNRDGVADVVAGAPGKDRAYVFSGRDGKVLLTLAGVSGEGYGGAASGAGDLNGDGHADVVVGAATSNAAGPGAGRAYVESGKDGATLRLLDGEAAGDAYGSIVAGAGKGKDAFLLVGAPGAGPAHHGRVYVYHGLTTAPQFVIDADDTGAALGAMFTSVVGDVDGDHVPDVYAADFSNAAKGPSTGRGYVHSGKDGKRLLTFTGESAGDGFGIGSGDVGDVDKDGHDDVLLGAWQFAGAAGSGGKIYLYSGKDGRLLRTITGRIPGETLGFDAAGIGDVDGDGVVDLLVTSSWSNVKGFHTGRMFVISGR
jgi:hypothetical protein